jgi:hypothetical protein
MLYKLFSLYIILHPLNLLMNLDQLLLHNTTNLRLLQNKTYDKRYFIETFMPLLDIGQHFEQLAIGRIPLQLIRSSSAR